MSFRLLIAAGMLLLCTVQPVWSQTLPCAVRGKVTLVDFTAVWCGPCKAQKPIVQALAKELGNRAAVVIVDIDKDTRARAYKVASIPTLVFHDAAGEVRYRHVGIMGREAILAKLMEIGLPPAAPPAVPGAPAAPTTASPRNTLTVY
ncbi:thioredoxin family protein [Megalodesulfovibrio gigas]|uniref:Putative thioredoxin n=1 Tax=Megalodesulfovibrio gigas (strain ATCC 19364 / DSM 1382 / NCIMB 9332 / VKM B-1759) TaxID=1121448 RepID=T2G8K8_MEGG1|nr:thioredoxin family protein [Megalodesulfovibrio gigas]AGW12514.1 putative thioredoxin [Megalodesulfovibrio gigas DSM 1382 = ATCC 19364]